MLVHGEQRVEVFGPIPAEGTITSTTRVVGIYDKGSGALAVMETQAKYKDSGKPAFNTRFGAFIRGEGGFGESRGDELPTRPKAPERAPDKEVTYETRSDQALLYRLSGDRNPLHSDPSFAKLAGFPKPILHGLCTYGVTGRALLHGLCGSDPAKFKVMDARFSKPVYPGDTLTVKMWNDGAGKAIFQTVTQEGTVVIDGGIFEYTA
jgi:acyl dehydratase